MNVSALINRQMLGCCDYSGLILWTHTHTRTYICTPHCSCICVHICVLQVEPLLPYEYTCEGMLERVHAYIQNQVGVQTRQAAGECHNDVMEVICRCARCLPAAWVGHSLVASGT